jgi:hypothetical protein
MHVFYSLLISGEIWAESCISLQAVQMKFLQKYEKKGSISFVSKTSGKT